MNVETIPSQDDISRLVDYPRMYEDHKGLIWSEVFQFPNSRPESVVWRKYATNDAEVHEIGLHRERSKKEANPDSKMQYAGFVTATVSDICRIKNIHGHGFKVLHEPHEGIHHAEISYSSGPTALTKPDKAELKLMLYKCFSELTRYSRCTT